MHISRAPSTLIPTVHETLFPGLFLAGFECSTPINRHGERIDQIAATQHDCFLEHDYGLMRRQGIRTVREAVRWHLVDQQGRYEMSSLRPFVDAAQRWGILPIWDLFHYGYPDDLDPFDAQFIPRFADYCYAVARYIDQRIDGTPFYTPVNEISYLAWAAGDQALFAPHATGRSFELKVNLVRAALAGIEAIWAVNSHARIVNADPLCHVVAPLDRPDLVGEAEFFSREVVYQSWDMLAGKVMPELGGSRRHLDIVGVNYYWTNQWEHTRPSVPLRPDDPRLLSLSDLLLQVHERYSGDILITETAHHGDNRPSWMKELACQVIRATERGARIHGICWYPAVGMTEWHEPDLFVPMGLWDLVAHNGTLQREANELLLAELAEAQRSLDCHLGGQVTSADGWEESAAHEQYPEALVSGE